MPTDKRMTKTAKKAVVVEDSDGLETAIQRAVNLINRKLKSLDEVDPEQLDGGELYKLSNSLAGLVRARSEHRKLDALRLEAIIQVRNELQTLIRSRLQKHPSLCEQLLEITEQVELSGTN